MEFYTVSRQPRPIRLPEKVRQWAWDSEHGFYGDEAMRFFAVAMDDVEGLAQLPPLDQYDAAILRIAQEAPLRLCPEEKVSGSATLGLAIHHSIPATLNGKPLMSSVSHFTANFRRTLTQGADSYEAEIQIRLEDPALTHSQRRFLKSMLGAIHALRIWHGRYLQAAREAGFATAELLEQVPFHPARTFREAVQSLWFTFAFMRLCGNWPGIGRIDWLLGDYLKKDLAQGRITLEEAREVLASMMIKGCEWIQSDTPPGSGDAQHYQNIVLGGIDEDGHDVTNEVTWLVLDIVEELAISDFPITVRIRPDTPKEHLRRIAEVVRHGGGVVAVYNEPLILKALERAGYDPIHARSFANDGCWEVQMPGETSFGYQPFDALQLLNDVLGVHAEDTPDYPDFESLYQAFLNRLEKQVAECYDIRIGSAYEPFEDGWRMKTGFPCSVVSLFVDGCIRKARSYYDLGPLYTVRSPHIGGAPDTGNSLYAIRRLSMKRSA